MRQKLIRTWDILCNRNIIWKIIVSDLPLTCTFFDDPFDVLGRNRVFVIVCARGDVGGIHGDCGLDLGLRLAHLVEEHLKDARISGSYVIQENSAAIMVAVTSKARQQ